MRIYHTSKCYQLLQHQSASHTENLDLTHATLKPGCFSGFIIEFLIITTYSAQRATEDYQVNPSPEQPGNAGRKDFDLHVVDVYRFVIQLAAVGNTVLQSG